MSLLAPLRPGDGSQDPPETLLETEVAIVHDPRLSPARMRAVAREVVRRLAALLDERRFADLPATSIRTEVFRLAEEAAPLYPLRTGGLRFASRLDLRHAMERALAGTPLAGPYHDLAGRAYDAQVEVTFTRLPGWDRPPAEDSRGP